MKYQYWIPSYDYNKEDALEVETFLVCQHPQDVAEEAAEDWHHSHNGWECSWPIVFHVLFDKKEYVYEVEREHIPAFRAQEQ